MSETVFAQHRISKQVAEVPAHYIGHPVLGENLIPVRAGKALFRKPGSGDLSLEGGEGFVPVDTGETEEGQASQNATPDNPEVGATNGDAVNTETAPVNITTATPARSRSAGKES